MAAASVPASKESPGSDACVHREGLSFARGSGVASGCHSAKGAVGPLWSSAEGAVGARGRGCNHVRRLTAIGGASRWKRSRWARATALPATIAAI